MKKRSFQNYVINSIESILNSCVKNNTPIDLFESVGSRNTIKSGFIAHYASIYYDSIDDTYANFWQSSNIRHCKNILMTQKAHDIYNSIYGNELYKSGKEKNGEEKYSYIKYKNQQINKDDNLLYWEHINPNGNVWDKIKLLYAKGLINPTEINTSNVTKCFSEHNLLLLTKAESTILDTNGGLNGQKAIAKYQELNLHSVAASRIKMLFEIVEIGYLYLFDKEIDDFLPPFSSFHEIYDGNGFTGKIKDYFENNDFTI